MCSSSERKKKERSKSMRPTEGNEVNRKEAREILLFTHTALLFVKEQLVKVAVPALNMAPPS